MGKSPPSNLLFIFPLISSYKDTVGGEGDKRPLEHPVSALQERNGVTQEAAQRTCRPQRQHPCILSRTPCHQGICVSLSFYESLDGVLYHNE